MVMERVEDEEEVVKEEGLASPPSGGVRDEAASCLESSSWLCLCDGLECARGGSDREESAGEDEDEESEGEVLAMDGLCEGVRSDEWNAGRTVNRLISFFNAL
jgi:hypothetical protein